MILLRSLIAAVVVFLFAGSVAHATPSFHRGPQAATRRDRAVSASREPGALRRAPRQLRQQLSTLSTRRGRASQRSVQVRAHAARPTRSARSTQSVLSVQSVQSASPAEQVVAHTPARTPGVRPHTASAALSARQELAHEAATSASRYATKSRVAYVAAAVSAVGTLSVMAYSALTGDHATYSMAADALPVVASFSGTAGAVGYFFERASQGYQSIARAFRGGQ